MKKPVSPTAHGIVDYVFTGIQLATPSLLAMNPVAARTYRILGAGFGLVNAFTNTPAGVKNLLSFKSHQKADAGFLAGLSLLGLAAFVRKDKNAMAFHLGFLALAIANYALTDYKRRPAR